MAYFVILYNQAQNSLLFFNYGQDLCIDIFVDRKLDFSKDLLLKLSKDVN